MATVDDVYDRLARLEESQAHLATKADLESLRGELRSEMEGLRGEVRSDIARMGSQLAWRVTGALIAILVALIGLMGVLTLQQL